MNQTSRERRHNDIVRLRALAAELPRVLAITQVIGDPVRELRLRITLPTVCSENWPREKQEVSEVKLAIPEAYPAWAPEATVTTPVYNPNIFSGGRWCYGTWSASETLDQFVLRLIKTLALDPQVINSNSPANMGANVWYLRNQRLFPTCDIRAVGAAPAAKPMVWKNIR